MHFTNMQVMLGNDCPFVINAEFPLNSLNVAKLCVSIKNTL